MTESEEERQLRSAALRNATSILLARQRAEEELLRAKEALEGKTAELDRAVAMLRATLEATTDAIVVTDTGGNATDFNQNFARMWDLQPGATAPGSAWRPFELTRHCFADPQRYIARIDEILASAETDMFDLLRTVDGRTIERCSRTQWVDGRSVGRVWSFRDISEREQLVEAERAARADLERAVRMKDEFLATLSHELRTPLTAILGWAKVLQRQGHDAPGLKQGIDTIARNAVVQAQLIDDLLDLSRIVFGKVRLDVQAIDLGSVIDAAVETVRSALQAKDIRLQQRIDPHLGPIHGDPHRLQQVVWNLLSNAVKFTPDGGRIDVALERADPYLRLVVSDSGVGIAADVLPHIFDRFRQADSSTTRRYGGLGLGLSIVKRLVEMHGGRIVAESAGEGRGASFVVTLPMRPTAEGADALEPLTVTAGSAPQDDVDLTGVKVLVIDDEADARELVRQMLEQANADVVTAESAAQAMRSLQVRLPDVMVSDIGMPGEDGYQLIRDVRRLAPEQGGLTPAIALTAYARSEDRTRAMRTGFQVHVSKPIEPPELLAAVAGLARRSLPSAR